MVPAPARRMLASGGSGGAEPDARSEGDAEPRQDLGTKSMASPVASAPGVLAVVNDSLTSRRRPRLARRAPLHPAIDRKPHQCITYPPSTLTVCPVTSPARSDDRNTTMSAAHSS